MRIELFQFSLNRRHYSETLSLLLELLPNVFFGELARQTLQKLNTLLHGEICLSAKRNQTLGKVLIVFHHQPIGDHQKVNIVEQDCSLLSVRLPLLQERNWVITPMPERVEVM